jgi:23S rRNA (adenine-N6)-dimethyltransferase
VGAQGSRSRSGESRPSGKHLLRSGSLARELVAQASIAADDLVLEAGAGTGRITEVLAASAARVIAVELDPWFAEVLRRRFRARSNVAVIESDILREPMPSTPFRVFGNVPFALTTAILRWLLDDPTSALGRADLIIQYEAARKRAFVWPTTLVSLGWLPWWEFSLMRRLPAAAFEPAPAVDAGLLRITKRSPPLLAPTLRADYLSLVQAGFRRADLPVTRSLRHRIPERAWKRLARERGVAPRSKANDLDVFDWVALFSMARAASSRAHGPVRPRYVRMSVSMETDTPCRSHV